MTYYLENRQKKRGCRRLQPLFLLMILIQTEEYRYSLMPEPLGSLVNSKRTSFSMTAGWLYTLAR